MLDQVQSAPKSSDFWGWFARNGERLRDSLASKVPVAVDEIRFKFQKAYPDLIWDLTPNTDGTWTFAVSADGRRDLFDKVLAIVERAPTVPGFRVRAFRQRGSAATCVRMGALSLVEDDVFCRVEPHADEGALVLFLYIRGLDQENHAALSRAAMLLVDNAIGEWDAVVRIGSVHIERAPASPATIRAFPLGELAAALDAMPRRRITRS